jgi:hypothetical protein
MTYIQDAADRLAHGWGHLLGGPVAEFESTGRKCFELLLRHGLTPKSYVYDIGCGCLRVGLWLIPFLERGHYWGFEPDWQRVNLGYSNFVGWKLWEAQRVRIHTSLTLPVDAPEFDFFLARSIWSHCAKADILRHLALMMDRGATGSLLLASYLPARVGRTESPNRWIYGPEWKRRVYGTLRPDYFGSEWAGTGTVVYHGTRGLVRACDSVGLSFELMPRDSYFTIHGQRWAVIGRKV